MSRFRMFVAAVVALALPCAGVSAQESVIEPAPAPMSESVQPPASDPPAVETSNSAEPPAAAAGPLVTFTVRKGPPSFVMSTAGKASFAMIGAIAMIAEGKRLAAELKLEEPANVVGAEIAAIFAASQGMSVASEPLAIADPKQDLIVSNGGNAAFVVDVAPVGLNAIYFPTDWSHYGLIYVTNVRIFDAGTSKLVGKAKCVIKPKKSPDSPTYEELIGNNGQGLRKLIAEANAACVAQLKSGLAL